MKSCVSLFSGCGGLDYGLQSAGFKILFASDNEFRCQGTHKKNFPETEFSLSAIADLDVKTVRKMAGLSCNQAPDLLAGGPPCQSFSKSRFYLKDKDRGFKDANGESSVRGYVRMLEGLKPKAFILENVPGFAYKIQKQAFDFVLRHAQRLGYGVRYSILNAADYGVPQTRKRFFMVGVLAGDFEFPAPTHTEKDKQADLLGQLLPVWRTAGEVLGDLDTEVNSSDIGHFAGGKHHELLKEVPPGKNYLHFTEKAGHPNPQFQWRSRYWSFLLKLSPELPSWTIQARRSNNMGPFHWKNRILRIEEIKRLQTFPDNFFLAGTVEQQWRQVGNAVPPLLAYHLGRSILGSIS